MRSRAAGPRRSIVLSQPAQTPRDCNKVRALASEVCPNRRKRVTPELEFLESELDVLGRGVVERPVQPRIVRARDLRDESQSRRVEEVQ